MKTTEDKMKKSHKLTYSNNDYELQLQDKKVHLWVDNINQNVLCPTINLASESCQ